MRIVIAGGSGFMGDYLKQRFEEDNNNVTILTRNPNAQENVYWDGKTIGEWTTTLENADVLINLAGKSVDCRYTKRNKNLIFSSRLESTAILGKAISSAQNPPKLWINSSTATIYEHSLYDGNTEAVGEIGSGFSVEVAKAWEKTFFDCFCQSTRQVALRTAIVLGNKGGAFVPFKRLVKLGLGGKMSSGRQMVSWVHQEDVYRAILFVMANHNIEGVLNLSSPSPVTNGEFMQALRKEVVVPFGLPHFKPMLEIAAFFMRTETELLLKSRYVLPERLLILGFKFKYNRLEDAIKSLV
ncbi:MAG: hypothetical protein RLZZ337_640 [Bacteroidota bacterium]|jgi:uncharacterized protein (TIGR01777 family)